MVSDLRRYDTHVTSLWCTHFVDAYTHNHKEKSSSLFIFSQALSKSLNQQPLENGGKIVNDKFMCIFDFENLRISIIFSMNSFFWYDWWELTIGLDNGLALSRRRAII